MFTNILKYSKKVILILNPFDSFLTFQCFFAAVKLQHFLSLGNNEFLQNTSRGLRRTFKNRIVYSGWLGVHQSTGGNLIKEIQLT